jgi:hypothetical protein
VNAGIVSTLPVETPGLPAKTVETKILPEKLHLKKEPVKAPEVPAAPRISSFAPMTPVLTPVDMTAPVRKKFSNLSVVLHRPTAGEVAVRVLKLDGTPVVLLYQGQLLAGKWGFDWDGRFADGHLAPPGYYQIQVQTGSLVQKKTVLVH